MSDGSDASAGQRDSLGSWTFETGPLAAGIGPWATPAEAAAKNTGTGAGKPDIIVIRADDFGCGDGRCYGATPVRAPQLDRLAREGMRFSDAHPSAARPSPLMGERRTAPTGKGVLPLLCA